MRDRIETEHLVLRKAQEEDLPAIWHNVWRDGELARMMLWKPTESREAAVVRMERTMAYQKENHAYFVCLKQNDEPIGFAGITETGAGEFEETGICIAQDWQNRGFGKEVLLALVRLAFDTLGGHGFRYGCFHENLASAALCKGCGFTYSHSKEQIREWDGYAYRCDYYTLERDADTIG